MFPNLPRVPPNGAWVRSDLPGVPPNGSGVPSELPDVPTNGADVAFGAANPAINLFKR